MELIYRVKKPETIHRFMLENNLPVKILELEDNHPKIYVNGQLRPRKSTVKKGEKIHFFVKDEGRDKRIVSEPEPLEIVFEDDYFLIVNKPKDMRMMISKAHPRGSLANRINHYYEEKGLDAKIHFVTKLDKEASGLIVVAKHKFIRYLVSDKFDNALMAHLKIIVNGKLDLKESCIPLPISRIDGSIKREVSEKGEECMTNYRVLKEFGPYSLVEIWIKNKLAHQIRVHFSYFYAPIVGDKIYGNDDVKDLMMYCHKLDFIHPITEEHLHLEVDAPDYFKTFMNQK